jgi:hypothetical protein
MPNEWYQPFVDASWSQNPGPFVFEGGLTNETDGCLACHSKEAPALLFAGRLPILDPPSFSYCEMAKGAFALTMPPLGPPMCSTSADCVDGLVCSNLVCRQPCMVDANCPDTQVCDNAICVQGSYKAAIIDQCQ